MADGVIAAAIATMGLMLFIALQSSLFSLAVHRKLLQKLQLFILVILALGVSAPSFAEILSPPTINGANPTATSNIGGTTSGTGNNGSLTNLGQLGSYNFSFSSVLVKNSAASPIQWNTGYNFVNTTTLQMQPRYAYFTNQTTNAPTGDAGYAAHTIQFNQAVKGLRFRWQGIDFGDDIEVFAFNGASVVPILASYYTINGGEKSAYSPRVNRFDAASALDSNAVGIRAIDPTAAGNSGTGVNTSVDFVFPSTVAVTRVLVRNGKSNISNGNVTTQVTNFAWEVETVKIQKISQGGVGTFGFSSVSNLASTPANIVTATAGVAAPAGPTSILATALNSNLTITESAATGYALTGFSCTDANSAVTGNTGTFGTFVSATRVGTIPAANVVQGATITCQFTNTRSTIKIQKVSQGGSGTFTFNTPVNMASAPASIGPTTAGVPSPTTPTAINVTTLGSNINLTEAPVAGFVMTGFSCTDANSASNGNTGTFGTFVAATGVVTVPAANVVAGSDINCLITNTKSPTLSLTKALGGNRVAAGDQFTVALRTGGVAGSVVNVTTNSTTTGATNVVTGGTGTTGTFTATAGTAYTLTEAASGTTNFAQYTSAITCTDSAGLQTGLPSGAAYTVAAGVTITPVAGAVISCTLTNTANNPVLTLAKLVVNTGGGTALASAWTLAASGPTNISGLTGAAPVTAVSVGAGAYTLSESGGPADINGGAADYSASTYSCVVNGGAAVSGNSITLNLGDTTVCTITNTFVVDSRMTIDKRLATGTPTPLQANQTVTYEFEVTNTGNVTLSSVNIDETAFNGSGTIGSFTPANGSVTLTPGASSTYTATYTVSQQDVDLRQ